MTSTTPAPLLQAATATFESLALLVARPSAGGAHARVPTPHAVSLAFAGPVRGRLVLRVSDDVRTALAGNMLGVDAPAPALQADALGELANVVCGNLLPALAGPAAVFRLGAPEPLAAGAPGSRGPRAGERRVADAALDVEGGRAELAVYLDAACAFAGPA
jgi:CheY-specific phosphatase CheX